MKRPILTTGKFYHIYNRGVDKRDVFMDDEDRFRFIHDLYEFNDRDPVLNVNFRLFSNYGNPIPIMTVDKIKKKRKPLVNIICFCLMPNHFHLILEQLVENGVSLFMQKIGAGYTNYFNVKNERVGSLFQGKFKVIDLDNENYLLHLSRYIHLNPVEIIEPEWKEEGVKDHKKVNQFLESYRWSSYLDYIGIKNFPSIISPDLINSYFKNPEEYKKFIIDFLPTDLNKVQDIIIEKK